MEHLGLEIDTMRMLIILPVMNFYPSSPPLGPSERVSASPQVPLSPVIFAQPRLSSSSAPTSPFVSSNGRTLAWQTCAAVSLPGPHLAHAPHQLGAPANASASRVPSLAMFHSFGAYFLAPRLRSFGVGPLASWFPAHPICTAVQMHHMRVLVDGLMTPRFNGASLQPHSH